MGSKNFSIHRDGKTNLRIVSIDKDIEYKRRMGINGIHFFNRLRIYYSKMGEAAKTLLNIFGLTGLFFGFISNIKVAPAISLTIGIISTVWAFFRMMKMGEDWLYRRAERREKEREVNGKIKKSSMKKYIPILLLFIGCVNTKKATNFMLTHPEVLAPICAKEFPVKDSLIKGDSVVLYDTLWGLRIISDTIVDKDTVRITITLPAKTITKTVHVTDTIIKENTARLAQVLNQLGESNNAGLVLSRKNDDLKEKIADMTSKRNKWRLWFWICVGAIGMFTLLKIKKLLPI